VVCTLIGVGVGWLISYKDTQTEINSLQVANQKLHEQNGMLHEQHGILNDQNQRLANQGDALKKQAETLTSILRDLASTRHEVQLALDRHSNITLEGKPIVDSKGRLLTDDSGNVVITTDSGVPLSVEGPPQRR